MTATVVKTIQNKNLALKGVVTAIPGANQFTIPILAGQGIGSFVDVANPHWAFVLLTHGGTGAAPQGEQQLVTAYNSTTGTFTTNAFTAPVGSGDWVLILHPDIANMAAVLSAIGALNNLSAAQVLAAITTDDTPFPGADVSKAAEAEIVDDHIHNYAVSFGVAAVPSGTTHVADVEGLTDFLLTSGAAAFGAPVQILGTSDTPVRPNMTYFDPREILMTSVSNATLFIIRVVWVDLLGGQTEAQAETAMQYTDVMVQQATVAGLNLVQECRMIRIPSGTALYAKIKNTTNSATLHFNFSIHEYPSPSP